MRDFYSVKSPVFPFNKFRGVDTILGPEMRSTGEVMGISTDFGQAFDFTAQIQGGHDDDVLSATESSQVLDPRYQVGGNYASSTVGLSYAGGTAGKAITFGARAGSDFRYSPPSLPIASVPRYEGSL